MAAPYPGPAGGEHWWWGKDGRSRPYRHLQWGTGTQRPQHQPRATRAPSQSPQPALRTLLKVEGPIATASDAHRKQEGCRMLRVEKNILEKTDT